MPNYNKSFNFRNGVQVDVDDLIVRGNLVGIGTTIPRADLDVRGTASITGLVTTTGLFVSGISTFSDEIHIGAGITISPQLGIISATFRGDASQLDNLPTSQWVDVDPGLGYTSIYNVGPVGVGTTNPLHTLQIGGSPDNPIHFGVGIDSTRGNIKTTGIVTAASFVGSGVGITAINASNINDGTLDSARFPASIAGLGEIGSTNLVVSGVGTVASLESTTAAVANLSATNLNVSGVSTLGVTSFTGGVTFGSDLLFGDNITLRIGDAVDGDLKLYHDGSDSYIQDSGDGNLILRGDDAIILEQTDGSEKYAQFNKSGSVELYYDNVRRFETIGTGATVTGELKVSNNATVLGVTTLTSVSASDATIGVSTVTTQNATEVIVEKVFVSAAATFQSSIDALHIDVDGQTTLDDVNISGIVTFGSVVNVGAGLTVNNNAVIDSLKVSDLTDNRLVIAGVDGELEDNAQLTFNGTTLNVTAAVDISGDTELDNVNVSGAATVTTLNVETTVIPDTDLGASLGSASKYFTNAYINQVNIGVAGTNKISTRNGTTLVLDSDQGTVVVDDNMNVTGVLTATSISTPDLNVSTSIDPETDQGTNLGSSNLRFSELYVDDVRIGVGSDQEIVAATGNLEIKAPLGRVNITNLSPIGVVTFSADALPNADKTVDLGSATVAYAQVHADELRIGVVANTLDTRSGDLNLNSFTDLVNVTTDLNVGNRIDTQELFVGTGGTAFVVDNSNQRIGIGTSAPTKAIEIKKYSDIDVDLISSNGSSRVIFAKESGITNDSARIAYNGSDLTVSNNSASGDVVVDLSTGSGINTTSNFRVQHSGNDLIHASHEGFIGINNTTPSEALDVNGNIAVSGNASVVGILTIGSGGSAITFGGGADTTITANINGNVNATSGVSTFSKLEAQRIDSQDLKVITGFATFMGGGRFGTDSDSGFDDSIPGNEIVTIDGSVAVTQSVFLTGNTANTKFAVGVSSIPEDKRGQDGFAPLGNLVPASYGSNFTRGSLTVMGQTNGTAIFVPGELDSTSSTLKYADTTSDNDHRYQFRVGINTHVPRSGLDLGGTSSPLIMPSLDAISLGHVVNNPLDASMSDVNLPSGSGEQVIGGVFYYEPDNCLKLGISTNNSTNSYVRIFHASTSGSIESFAVPQASAANVTTLGSDSNIPEGAIVYNTASDDIQVKRASGFGSIGFVKAFGRVNSGTLQSGSYNAAYTNPSGTIARITFSTALSSANYTIVYSHANSNGTWSNVTNTITSQTTTQFEISWGTLSGLDWYFVVLQV